MENAEWKHINHPNVKKEYLISSDGVIKNKRTNEICGEDFILHSNNGYDYVLLANVENNKQFFAIDELVAFAYLGVPDNIKDKIVTVKHINCDLRDNTVTNLAWVENHEEWLLCTYPKIYKNEYEISSWGRVRNIRTSHIYSLTPDSHNHYYVRLKDMTGKWINFAIHRLVCYEFNNIEDYSKYDVNHIDGNPRNNYVKNLEWVTRSVNNMHALLTCLRVPYRIFTESEVRKICEELLIDDSGVRIFNKLKNQIPNLKMKDISSIKRKFQYKEISDEYFSDDYFSIISPLTENDVRIICETLVKYDMSVGKTYDELKTKYTKDKLSYFRICRIKMCKTYRNISKEYF